MKLHRLTFPILATLISFSACSGMNADDPDWSPLDDNPDLYEPVDSTQLPLPKGTVGAVNGQDDYCDGATQCVSGEGDCDKQRHCAAGTICGPNVGANFGFSRGTDVCVPAHCTNQVLDAGSGETQIDCGGPCGTNCLPTCSGTPGSATFCSSCLCSSGQGDCDSKNECQPGLICGSNNGPKFGLGETYDVCVPPHCQNGVQDSSSGETGIDTGGPCSSAGPPPPVLNVFFSEYVEGSGLHHHLEIYNAGAVTATCTVNVYLSGSTTPTAVPLSAPLASGQLFLLCRSGAGLGTPPCDQRVTTLSFNGDDAVELVCNSEVQDIIGQIGLDPGAEWGTGLQSTADNTIRRKCSVTTGDKIGNNAFTPATEWDGFALNTLSDLGTRSCPQ